MNFLVYQREKCPTTGTLHYQTYVEFMEPHTGVLALRKLGIKSGRFIEAKGTADDNIKYCTKEDTKVPQMMHFMFGSPKKQGKRNDLLTYQEELEDGWSVKDILLNHKGDAIRYVNMLCRTRAILLDMDERENMLNDRQRFLKEQALRQPYPSHYVSEDMSDDDSAMSEKDKEFLRQQTCRSETWKPTGA